MIPFIAAALVIEALLLYVAGIAGSIVRSIVLLLLGHAVYVFAVYRVLKHGVSRHIIIPAALVFRITVAALPTPATDDVYRYRWEAMVQQAGGNPYASRPDDPGWVSLRDSAYERVPLKEFKAGYGPAWELLSLWTLRGVSVVTDDPHWQVLWMKAPAALFDLGVIGVLMLLLRARGLPESRVLIYAWAPLPVWEFWANGHNDAVLVFFLVAAFALAARGSPGKGASALGVAIAVKWWPAVLLIAWGRRHGYVRTAVLATAVLLLFAVPYLSREVMDATENAQFMSGFVGGWRNNDSLFGLVLFLAGGDLYLAKYTAFGLIGAAWAWLSVRDWPLERVALWGIVVLLLISANCHPWYLTWFLPLLALYPHPSLLLWVSLVPLAYAVRIPWETLGVWNGSTPERWWIYGPVFAVMVWELWRWRQNFLMISAHQPKSSL